MSGWPKFGEVFGRRFGGAFGQGGGNTLTLNQYLQSLGAVLLYDGTLNGSNIRNLGSGGVTLDGVPTNVTIDANGMNFNGTDSTIAVPVSALISDLAAYTYLTIGKATSVGENNGGRLYNWANLNTNGSVTTTGTISYAIARAVGASSTLTNFLSAYPSALFISFLGWNGSNITGHAAKGSETSYTAGTNSDGSGAVTSLTGQQLFVGNRQLNDRTWDGSIRQFAIINKVLSAAERTQIGQLAGFLIS